MLKEEFVIAADKYKDTIFRVAYSWTKNSHDANDVTQEVLLHLFQSTKEYESDDHLKNWLIKVTINQCKMLFRSPWSKMEDIGAYAEKLGFEDENYHDLFIAVMRLDKKYRVPILLFYYEGYSTSEIARLLDLPEKNSQHKIIPSKKTIKGLSGGGMRMGANQEKFKNTFDNLHASPDVVTEVLNMSEKRNRFPIRRKYITSRAAAAAAAVCLLAGSGTAAYAMNVGGIQRIVQIWTHGNQTNATFTVEDGAYTLEYTDEDGNKLSQEGGGIAYNADGTQRALTTEELMEQLSMPEVVYEEDGSVWIYYYNQKMEITEKFKDGVCYVELKANGKTQYVTVEYEKGYTMSEVKFQQPAAG